MSTPFVFGPWRTWSRYESFWRPSAGTLKRRSKSDACAAASDAGAGSVDM